MSGLALRARRYAEKLIRAELATSKILAIQAGVRASLETHEFPRELYHTPLITPRFDRSWSDEAQRASA